MEGRPRVPPHVDSMQGMSDQGGARIGGWRASPAPTIYGFTPSDPRLLVEPMLAYMWYYRARYPIVLL